MPPTQIAPRASSISSGSPLFLAIVLPMPVFGGALILALILGSIEEEWYNRRKGKRAKDSELSLPLSHSQSGFSEIPTQRVFPALGPGATHLSEAVPSGEDSSS
jgi:hypothetical protein